MLSCLGPFFKSGINHVDNDDAASSIAEKQSLDDAASVATLVTSSAVNETSEQLKAIREKMKEDDLDFYIVPSEDQHGSEYVAPRDELRTFITGFNGDAGVAVIGADGWAGLFVDGRFHAQAEKQIDHNWTLFKVGNAGVPVWTEWLVKKSFEVAAKDEVRFGVDARRVAYATIKQLLEDAAKMAPSGEKLVEVCQERSLVEEVWKDPALPFSKSYPAPFGEPVHIHPLKFAGESAQDKLFKLVRWLKGADVDKLIGGPAKAAGELSSGSRRGGSFVINSLDEIAWLLNLRGYSIPHNPVFPSYIVVKVPEEDSKATYEADLYITDGLLPSDSDAFAYVRDELKVSIKPYDAVWDDLRALSEAALPAVVSDKASYAIVSAVDASRVSILEPGSSPLALLKAVKNATELQGMRNGYLRDGIAWAQWAAWLEEQIVKKGKKVDEWDAAVKLRQYREKMPLYPGFEAYPAIAASGPNAAYPHYTPTASNSRIIDTKTPFLMDSGSQYYDATIDTTRTVHFGRPTAEQKRAYTRVLQGHITIDATIFPSGSTGATLDTLARRPLWQDRQVYGHGTGHGIGAYLNVHEGPQGFSSSSGGSTKPVAFRPGMCVSNEPGYYKAVDESHGGFGIRIESVLAVKSLPPTGQYGEEAGAPWLAFERLTRCPIALEMIEWKLLSTEEKKWLKEHNLQCYEEVSPALKKMGDKRAVKWLKRQC